MIPRWLVLPIIVAFCGLTAGCIALPIPHKAWATPELSGTVVDSQTGRGIPDVQLLINTEATFNWRRIESSARTNQKGEFHVPAQSRWRLIWCILPLLPASGFVGGEATIKHHEYHQKACEFGRVIPPVSFPAWWEPSPIITFNLDRIELISSQLPCEADQSVEKRLFLLKEGWIK